MSASKVEDPAQEVSGEMLVPAKSSNVEEGNTSTQVTERVEDDKDFERGKYSSDASTSTLFTWKGFVEKVNWVFSFFFSPCATPEQYRDSPIPEPKIDDESDTIEAQSSATEVPSPETESVKQTKLPTHSRDSEPDEEFVDALSTTILGDAQTKAEGIEKQHRIPVPKITYSIDTDQDVQDQTEVVTNQETSIVEKVLTQETKVVEKETTKNIEKIENLANEGIHDSKVAVEREKDYVKDDYLREEFTEASESFSNQIITDVATSEPGKDMEKFEKIEKELEGELKTTTTENSEKRDSFFLREVEKIEEKVRHDVKEIESDEVSQNIDEEASGSDVEVAGLLEESEIPLVVTQESDELRKDTRRIDEVAVYEQEVIAVNARRVESEFQEEIIKLEYAHEEESTSRHISGMDMTEREEQKEISLNQDEKQENIESLYVPGKIDIIINAEKEESEAGYQEGSRHDESSISTSSTTDNASLSTSSMRSKKDEKDFKVDVRMKRVFKRKVQSYVKQVIKSKPMQSFHDGRHEEIVINPTLLRVDKEKNQKQGLTLKKTDLGGSISSLIGTKNTKEDDVRRVAVIGFEGYGKTMLLKRIADKALGRLLDVYELNENGGKRKWHPFSRKDIYKFVHYIDYRDLPTIGEYTPDELLFRTLIEGMEAEESELGYRWLQIYKKSVLFIIDGICDLNQFPEEVRRHVGYSDKASPQTIMYNLITGNILPNAHVLLSANANDASKLVEVVAPNRIYAMSGFDRSDIKGYLAKNSPVWKKLSDGDYNNLLCSSKVPLGLFYANGALSDSKYDLDTLPGAILHYVTQAMIGMEQWESDSYEVMKKLTKAAYICSIEDHEVLDDEILASIGLSAKEVKNSRLFDDRVVGRLASDGTITWKKLYAFCHVTIREFLSSLQLCQDTADDVRKFWDARFHDKRFSFQKKTLFGILFNNANLNEVKSLVTVAEVEDKKEFLKTHLVQWIESEPPSLYLYTVINDSPDAGIDSILKEKMRKLSLVGSKLTSVSVFILSSIAYRIASLDALELRNCSPSEEVLRRFVTTFKTGQVEIKVLNLRGNPGILSCGPAVRDICRYSKVQELNFGGCNFHGEILVALPRILRDISLKSLNIDDNPDIGDNSLHNVCEFVRKSGAEHLFIGNTGLNDERLKKLKRSLKNTKLTTLNVSRNREFGKEGVAVLGTIVEDCGLQNLNMAFCGVIPEHFRSFQTGLKKVKLNRLDASSDDAMETTAADVITLCSMLAFVKEELRIENWQFSTENLETFKEKFLEMAYPGMKIIYGSENESITKPV